MMSESQTMADKVTFLPATEKIFSSLSLENKVDSAPKAKVGRYYILHRVRKDCNLNKKKVCKYIWNYKMDLKD